MLRTDPPDSGRNLARPLGGAAAPRPWWVDDYFHGYRAHLSHPYTVLQGDSLCSICGGHADRRIHDAPYVRQAEPDPPTPQELSEQPRPRFTDTSWAARQDRLSVLKEPAVSTAPGGDSEKVVQVHPETAEDEDAFGFRIDRELGRVRRYRRPPEPNPHADEDQKMLDWITDRKDPMNLNITTEPGKVKTHRAVVQSEDGTQGVFCEADDLQLAISQAVTPLMNGTSAATFAGVLVSNEQRLGGLKSRIDGPTRSPEKIRELIEQAIEDEEYIQIRYKPTTPGSAASTRKVYPIRLSFDGLSVECRQEDPSGPGRGYRRFILSRILSARRLP